MAFNRFKLKRKIFSDQVALSIDGSFVTTATVGQAYAGSNFTASGGTPAVDGSYTFSMTPGSDALVNGFSLTQTGPNTCSIVAANPTTVQTLDPIAVRVTDNLGATDDTPNSSITVVDIAPVLLAADLADLFVQVGVAVAAGADRTIALATGGSELWGSDIINLAGYTFSHNITIRSQSYTAGVRGGGAVTPGFRTSGTTSPVVADSPNFTFAYLECVRLVKDTDVDNGVMELASDTTVHHCIVHGLPTMLTMDRWGYIGLSNITGTFTNGERVTTAEGGHGYIHKQPSVGAGVVGVTGPNGSDLYPAATATNPAITDIDGRLNRNGFTAPSTSANTWQNQWSGKTLVGQDSGATALIGARTNALRLLSGIKWINKDRVLCYDNEIYDVQRGYEFKGQDCVIDARADLVSDAWVATHYGSSYIHDFYVAPYDASENCDGTMIGPVKAINGWVTPMDAQPAGTNGPHASLGGESFGWRVLWFAWFGHLKSIGNRRAVECDGQQADASADKLNDGDDAFTASIAPDVGSNPATSTMTVTTVGSSSGIAIGARIMSNVGTPVIPSSSEVEVLAQLTGTATKTGTYTISGTWTKASVANNMITNGRYSGFAVGNLVDSNLSQGNEIDFTDDFRFTGNTNLSCRDTRLLEDGGPYLPSIYFGVNDGSTRIFNNVANGTAQSSTTGVNSYVATEMKRHSTDNLILDLSATSGSDSYEDNYNGASGGAGPFHMAGRSIDDLLTMFTPKPGAVISGTGHTKYWNHSTNQFVGDFAGFAAKIPTNSTGLDLASVAFGGTKWARYTVSGTEKIAGFANGNALTIILDMDMLSANNTTPTLIGTNSSGIVVTRLSSTGNKLRIVLKGTSTATNVSIDTRFGLTLNERALILMSFDFANYRYCLMKNGVNDALPTINTWTGEALNIDADTLTFFATSGGGSITNANCRAIWMANEFIDPTKDQALMNRFCALDGKPFDWGPDGSTLTGREPEIYAKGNAAAWNGGPGINLGSAPRLLIPSTAVLDA